MGLSFKSRMMARMDWLKKILALGKSQSSGFWVPPFKPERLGSRTNWAFNSFLRTSRQPFTCKGFSIDADMNDLIDTYV
jgi:hypothetical protein